VTDCQLLHRRLVSGRESYVFFVSKSTSSLPSSTFFLPVDMRAVCPGSRRSEPEDDWLYLVFFNIAHASLVHCVVIFRQQIENRKDTQPQCSLQVQIEWKFTYTPPMNHYDRYFGFNIS